MSEIESGIELTPEQLRQAAAQIGRKGGRVKSAAKTLAAQENGRKGGRPKVKKPLTKEK